MPYQIDGDSKEAVAFGLMQCILMAEGRADANHPFPRGSTLLRERDACSEAEILSLYARCLRVVQGEDPAGLPRGMGLATAGPTPIHS